MLGPTSVNCARFAASIICRGQQSLLCHIIAPEQGFSATMSFFSSTLAGRATDPTASFKGARILTDLDVLFSLQTEVQSIIYNTALYQLFKNVNGFLQKDIVSIMKELMYTRLVINTSASMRKSARAVRCCIFLQIESRK